MTYLGKYFELQLEYEYDPDICINNNLKFMVYNKKIGHISELCNILKFTELFKIFLILTILLY